MTDSPHSSGQCACGEVRYYLTSAPIIVHCCHCRSCQRESGTAFAINAMIETARVVVTAGEPEEIMTPSASGKGQRIVRCPHCHVALWSHYAGGGDALSFVRVGTLDNPDALPPDLHIFTQSKQPWVHLPDDARAFEVYYDRAAEWPTDSIERHEAVKRLGTAERD